MTWGATLVLVFLIGWGVITLSGYACIWALRLSAILGDSTERAAWASMIGMAAWTLGASALFRLGFTANAVLGIMLVVILLTAVVAACRDGVRSSGPTRPDVAALSLTGAVALAGLFGLLPVLLGGAYPALNDTVTYVCIAEYVRDYGFADPVVPDPYQPTLSQAAWFYRGSSLGSVYLLALVSAAVPSHTVLELYPAVSALGLGLVVCAVFLLARSGLRLAPRYALLAAFAFAVTPNPVAGAAAHGFLRQTYGLAALCATLALLHRPPWDAPFDARRPLLLGTMLAFIGATYVAVLPVAGVVLAGLGTPALYLAQRRGDLARALRAALLAGVAFLVAINSDLVRAISAIPRMIEFHIHWPWAWSFGDFLSFAVGARPRTLEMPFATDDYRTSIMGLAVILLMIGVGTLVAQRRGAAVLGGLLLFAAMSAYYASRITWGVDASLFRPLYKVAQWAYPLVLVAQVAGLSALGQHARRGLVPAAVVATALVATVSQVSLAQERAFDMQGRTGTPHLFETFRALRAEAERHQPDTIYLVADPGQAWLQLLYAHVVSSYPVAGDWTASPPQIHRFFPFDVVPARGATMYVDVMSASWTFSTAD